MKIFQIKTKPHGIERFQEFINEEFVCIGWPGLGNLKDVGKDEIRNRLEEEYKYTGHKLGNALGQVNTFVNTMKNGDVILITKKNSAHIGIVGEYLYEKKYDNQEDGMCHRRNVKWKNEIPLRNLSSSLQRLVNNRNTICQFSDSLEASGIYEILGKQPLMNKNDAIKLDNLFSEALLVLEKELKSEDPDRRLKAAAELMRLKNS